MKKLLYGAAAVLAAAALALGAVGTPSGAQAQDADREVALRYDYNLGIRWRG